jgi:DNA-binding response OmpR family regulator
MPGIDGWETARRVRAEHGDAVPILMVSANLHDFQRTRRPDDPHDDFLVKPYEIEDLFERIGVLLSISWSQGTAPCP